MFPPRYSHRNPGYRRCRRLQSIDWGRRLARLLSGIDLAIDLATLGEYGLEPLPAEAPCRMRRPTERSAWEGR